MPTRRIPIGAVLPFALLVVAGGLWSIGWFYAASEAEARFTDWRRTMAADGAELLCDREEPGGYPFRLSLTCDRPRLRLAAGPDRYELSGRRLQAVAQVYDTEHFIIELDAPAVLTRGEAATPVAEMPDGALRISVELDDGIPQRVSIVPSAFTAYIPEGNERVARLAVASSGLHLRNRLQENAYDIAINGSGLAFDGTIGEGETIAVDQMELIVAFNNLPDAGIEALDQFLRRWRDDGGTADVRRLGFDSPSLGSMAQGTVRIGSDGHLQGELDAAFTKLEEFVKVLKDRDLISDNEARLTVGAVGFLGQQVQGRRGIVLPVQINAGTVFIGPVKVVSLPPLL